MLQPSFRQEVPEGDGWVGSEPNTGARQPLEQEGTRALRFQAGKNKDLRSGPVRGLGGRITLDTIRVHIPWVSGHSQK